MKSFSLYFFGLLCVAFVSAQEISEDKFIPQLKTKQEELYKLIDKKDSLTVEIAILSKNIEKLTNEAEKKEKEDKKEDLEKQVSKLANDITEKCDEYADYHKLLSKFQGVSDALLNKYKVRICQLYVTSVQQEEVAAKDNNDRAAKELEKRQTVIDSLVEVKDFYDETIASINKDIKLLELEIKDINKTKEEVDTLKEELKSTSKSKDSILIIDKEVEKQIMDSCGKFKEYKTFLKEHENVKDSILNLYRARNCRLFEKKEELDPEKFIIVGDNEPIKTSELLSNENTRQVLRDVFSIDSKTNLGTFEIPGDNESINLYVEKGIAEDSTKLNNFKKIEYENAAADELITVKTAMDTAKYKYEEIPQKTLFKSIQIELLEGGIVDIRLVLESLDGNTHFYFEGSDPVSILNYSRKGPKRRTLKFSHYVSLNGTAVYNEKALEKLRVKLTDVLDYHPNAGSNYVPDNVSYKFPSEKEEEAKITGRRSYQVVNNNHLQHVLDLRTYTDMLGLFSDEANGLFQIEGKADFFTNPFNFPGSSLYWLKKVSPYVRYSRLDDEKDFLSATLDTGTSMYKFNDNKLELLERSNLEMGIEINMLNFRTVKESPVWISLYIPFTYNVTRVQADVNLEKSNFKTLGYGLGAEAEIKRFNNFGLRFGYEAKLYSFLGSYNDASLQKPEELITQAVRAEIFYYPGLDKSQSIFLRMKSIKDISPGSGDSFFQLQVGYRFTIGVGAIKAK